MTEDEILKIKEHIEIHARREPRAIKITEIMWKAVGELEHIAELEKENTELIQENEEMKKGLGCETCQIHLEFAKLNQKITELEAQIEKMKCCGNCIGTCNSDDMARFCKDNNYKLWGDKL